jgi:flagellar biosynthesis component FlhA
LNNLENKAVSERKKRLNGKIKDLLIIGGLALLIVFAAWKIFYQEEQIDGQTSVSTLSESEEKVSRLLEEIDGVGEAEVMICETEEGVEGVVVVCEGAKNLQVVMDIREAVAAALGTKQNAVKIYLKKE